MQPSSSSEPGELVEAPDGFLTVTCLIVMSAALDTHDPVIAHRVRSQLRDLEQAEDRPYLILCESVDRSQALRPLDTAVSSAFDVLIESDSSGGWHRRSEMVINLGALSGARAAVEATRDELGSGPEGTIVVGARPSDLQLARSGQIYLHVGDEIDLGTHIRGLVPAWGQGPLGLINLISHFAERGWRDRLMVHSDVLGFLDRTRDYYADPQAVSRSFVRHERLSTHLHSELGDQLAGVFGTGFPFYSLGAHSSPTSEMSTPASIIRYVDGQAAYFRAKMLSRRSGTLQDTWHKCADSVAHLFDLELRRNRFEEVEFTSRNATPPDPLPESATVGQFYGAGLLGSEDDPWPCHLCVALQAPDLRPHQSITKDTNETCLRCRQTPLVLRNVMTASADIDMVLVLHDEAKTALEEIKATVRRAREHLYDLDLPRVIWGYGDGPVDLFVTSVSRLEAALVAVRSRSWLSAEFECTALWSLTKPVSFNLGEDFPISFVEQGPLDPAVAHSLRAARKDFALRHDADSVIRELRCHSLSHNQILENSDVIDALRERLRSWTLLPD